MVVLFVPLDVINLKSPDIRDKQIVELGWTFPYNGRSKIWLMRMHRIEILHIFVPNLSENLSLW